MALVRSGLGLAEALRRRGEPRDVERAGRVDAAARAEAERLGIGFPELVPLRRNPS